MTNLLQETLKCLAANDKIPADVQWVGVVVRNDDPMPVGSWKDFERFADIDYDSSYGSAEIAEVVIVGKNWWLERGEYDGSEWWDFKTLPLMPIETTPLRASDLKYRD